MSVCVSCRALFGSTLMTPHHYWTHKSWSVAQGEGVYGEFVQAFPPSTKCAPVDGAGGPPTPGLSSNLAPLRTVDP